VREREQVLASARECEQAECFKYILKIQFGGQWPFTAHNRPAVNFNVVS